MQISISIDEAMLDPVLERLDRLESKINAFIAYEVEEDIEQETAMSDVSLRIDTVRSEIAEQTTVIDGLKVYVNGIRSDLQAVRDDLAARGVSDEDLAALDALASSVDTNTTEIENAMVEGTSSEGEVPTDEPTEPSTDRPMTDEFGNPV